MSSNFFSFRTIGAGGDCVLNEKMENVRTCPENEAALASPAVCAAFSRQARDLRQFIIHRSNARSPFENSHSLSTGLILFVFFDMGYNAILFAQINNIIRTATELIGSFPARGKHQPGEQKTERRVRLFDLIFPQFFSLTSAH